MMRWIVAPDYSRGAFWVYPKLALIVSLSHRSSLGLTFDVSYTWSKTITDADSAIGGINGGIPGLIPNNNLKTGKSTSIQDVPNYFVTNYLYQLPIGKGKHFLSGSNRLVDALVSGISFGGIQRYLSGVPFSYGCASVPVGYNDCPSLTLLPGAKIRSGLNKHSVNPFAYILPSETANAKTPYSNPGVDSIFNGLLTYQNAAYSANQPHPAFVNQNEDTAPLRNGGAYTFGNLSRVSGAVRNFAYLQEDFVFIKDTPLYGDRFKFQFKVECLDCFNRRNFQAPDSTPGDAAFGVPLAVVEGATDSMRRLQLTGRFNF